MNYNETKTKLHRITYLDVKGAIDGLDQPNLSLEFDVENQLTQVWTHVWGDYGV